MELTKQIRDIVGVDEFESRIEEKYEHKIVGHHQEQGIGVYELDNGDEVKYWDEKKLIGNPFHHKKGGGSYSHFTNTKYSESGYKKKGTDEFEYNYPFKFGAGTLAYAKSIGMTAVQIRKAEAAGVGNTDDIREELRKIAWGDILYPEPLNSVKSKTHTSDSKKHTVRKSKRTSPSTSLKGMR